MRRRFGALAAVAWLLPGPAGLAGVPPSIEQAERLAAEARQAAASRPKQALVQARRALAATAEFEPTAFVAAGRKGEVVEDAFLAARAAYRRHRARLYGSVGECLLAAGRVADGTRYLRRAADLDPTRGNRLLLARALVSLGRAGEALPELLTPENLPLSPDALAVAGQAADAAGLASLQAAIDRVRLGSLQLEPRPVFRDGRFGFPERARLSSGGPARLEPGLTVVYAAEASCRSCSADLEQVHRQLPADARVLALPASAEHDQELRQALRLYRYPWPLLVGLTPQALGLEPPAVLVVAREGFSALVLRAPFGEALSAVAEALGREDVQESRPRPQWRPQAPPLAPPARPGLLPEGLAPGEDAPAPKEFDAAVAAFRAGRPAEAESGFEALAARGDGWLLPPEARLDRAQCLAAQGRRDEARRILLAIGDSRFQEDVDRILEGLGSRRKTP